MPALADQHVLVAFGGLDVPDDVAGLLAAGEVPGVTLFRHANVASADQVAELTARLQELCGSELPLLVAADQETGQLLGLGDDTTAFPGAMALGAAADPAWPGASGSRSAASCVRSGQPRLRPGL